MIIDKKSDIKTGLFLTICPFLLFFCTFNLGGYYKYLSLIIFGISVLYISMYSETIIIRLQDTFVFVLLLTYFIFSLIWGKNETFAIIQYSMFYISGRVLCQISSAKDENNLIKYILLGSIGFSLYAILTVLSSQMTHDKRIPDIWNNQPIATTQYAAWLILLIAFLPYVMNNFRNISIIKKAIIIFTMIGAVGSIFIMASRTGMLIIALAIVMGFYFLLKDKRKTEFLVACVVFCALIIAYVYNLFGLKEWVDNSNLVIRLRSSRVPALQSSRMEYYEYVIKNFFKHIWGGFFFSNEIGASIHNIFLDLYDATGIIPLIALVLVFIKIAQNILFIIKSKNILLPIKIVFICWFSINIIQLLLEPVWSYGYKGYLSFIFFCIGGLESYVYIKKTKRHPLTEQKRPSL